MAQKTGLQTAVLPTITIVIAQTDKEKGHRGINAFIVEKGMDGFSIGPKEDNTGHSRGATPIA